MIPINCSDKAGVEKEIGRAPGDVLAEDASGNPADLIFTDEQRSFWNYGGISSLLPALSHKSRGFPSPGHPGFGLMKNILPFNLSLSMC
jgi:hypothetical protein